MPRSPKKPGESPKGGNAYKPVTQWKPAPGEGWQHGEIPPLAMDGPHSATVQAWDAWMSSWWAAFWVPGDLPQLQLAAVHFDAVARGQLEVGKLIPLLDKLGITPKGRQDLRWLAPEGAEEEATPAVPDELHAKRAARKLA